jgi:hypothetical protein
MNISDILMVLTAKQNSTSRYSGKVFMASSMLIFIFVACLVFARYGTFGGSLNKYNELNNQSSSSKFLNKVGVVKGISCSPTSSCAVVGETLVHVGDKINNIVVVGIQSDAVEFAKDGVTWRQAVLEAPNPAWTNPAK